MKNCFFQVICNALDYFLKPSLKRGFHSRDGDNFPFVFSEKVKSTSSKYRLY